MSISKQNASLKSLSPNTKFLDFMVYKEVFVKL